MTRIGSRVYINQRNNSNGLSYSLLSSWSSFLVINRNIEEKRERKERKYKRTRKYRKWGDR